MSRGKNHVMRLVGKQERWEWLKLEMTEELEARTHTEYSTNE